MEQLILIGGLHFGQKSYQKSYLILFIICDDVDDYDMGVFNDLDWKLEKSSFSNGIFFVKEPLWAKTWQRNS